ncbi:MAG TPA: PEP-CTERM sorting domain-containing protein [Lacipirellulaceae bacterium]|nr:PEP-CTERM sorting domain-containing protein [Lacipirellulaceae bacterium]
MRHIALFVIPLVAAFLLAAGPNTANAVFDDFSDMNDTANPNWTHLDGLVASTGQTWDASTGQYRMTAQNNGFSNLGFVGAYTGPSFTDVQVAADIVSFLDDPQAQGAPFGIGARLDGNNAFNSLKGYAYAYEPHAAGGAGEVVLYRINGASLVDLGAQQVTLDPNKDYRFVLNVTGSQLHGQVFEIGGGMVAERFATDATHASGFSGLFAYSQNPIPPVDVTWDNFSAQVPEPATCLLVAFGAALISLNRRRG